MLDYIIVQAGGKGSKRELLGFNIEEFAYEAGVNAGSYKE